MGLTTGQDVEVKIKGVVYDPDRHGTPRWYFRKKGHRKVRLVEQPGTDAFLEEVRCAKLGVPYKSRIEPAPALSRKDPTSFEWLCDQYMERHVKGQAEATYRKKKAVLAEVCNSEVVGSKGGRVGEKPFAMMRIRHVAQLRDEKSDKPEAANHRVKVISAMFKWAVGSGLAEINPATGCGRLSGNGDGFHTMTEDELNAFMETHGPGTKARLAGMLFRYTGLRISDVVVFGRQHTYMKKDADGTLQARLKIKPKKTRNSSGVVVDMPIVPPLLEELARHESNNLTFLVTDAGNPFTVNGFGNRMRDWFDAAGLQSCTSHSFRKHDAVVMAESGATEAQLNAVFGWTSPQQSAVYLRKVNRSKLATSGSAHLFSGQK